jgi:hypothetical protein
VAIKTDIRYSKDSRPRGKLKQIGSAYRPYLTNTLLRPIFSRLREYEYVALYDTTVSAALRVLINTLIASLGEIEHQDKEIQDYCRYCIQRMQDRLGLELSFILYTLIHTTLIAGYSVSEHLYEQDDKTGALVLQDIVTYHPSTILIRTNMKGRLTEDEPSYDGFVSGIYQVGYNQPQVQLPFWKILHLNYDSQFGNYYGRSIIETVYKWHLLKEAFIDMMATALDRYTRRAVRSDR